MLYRNIFSMLTGLDYLFIGPNDLAQSLLGYTPARGDEPVFVDAIKKIVAAAKKHGKWVGRLVNDGEGAVRELKTFDSVAITGDTKAVTNWYTAQIAQVRG
jgi:4-hydroxy-2-oxoheptanedioate aldolase